MVVLERFKVHVDLMIDECLMQVARQCIVAESGDGALAQAAVEIEQLAKELKHVVMHTKLNGAEVLVRALDAMRALGRPEYAKRIEHVIALMKQGQNRKIVGAFMAQPQIKQLLQAAGDKGANIVGLEHPESGDIVKIAKVTGG